MAFKFKKRSSYEHTGDQKNKKLNLPNKNSSKLEELYVILTCFATHCLSCITLEAGGRTSHSNALTKSAAFNALFRRPYNLKIIVFITNIITGLITTLMMLLGDRYGVPYLYVPWLVNTIKGMALSEGPALLNMANVLLPNLTLPTTTFMVMTFLLYVEELCIWNDVFVKFQHCWKNYHSQKRTTMERAKEILFNARKRRLLPQSDAEIKSKIENCTGKFRTGKKTDEFCNNDNIRNDMDNCLRPTKSTVAASIFYRNQLLDITG